jgi:ABC-type lipoprotein release transport system permease subunit
MGSRFDFYIKQSFKNIRKSVLIIIGLGMAISMVAGIGYYSDAYQKYSLDQSFTQIVDFNVIYRKDGVRINETYGGTDDTIKSYMEQQDLNLEKIVNFHLISSYSTKFYRNFSGIPASQLDGLAVYEETTFNVMYFDEGFYNSYRFNEYFEIISGTAPKAENQIMIDATFAAHFNLSLGQTYELNVKTLDYSAYYYLEDNANQNDDTSSIISQNSQPSKMVPHSSAQQTFAYKTPALTISGIYQSILDQYSFGYEYYYANNIYSPATEQSSSTTDLKSKGIGTVPVFTYYNFTKRADNHPFQTMLISANQTFGNTIKFDQTFYFTTGFACFYDRTTIDYNKINSISRDLSQKSTVISHNIPNYVYYQDHLSSNLQQLYMFSQILRWIMQIMNVPILIFALFIGSFAIKTNAKSRLDEFLLLRSKGTPSNMIRNQFLMEGLINGIISSAIGCVIGIGTFFGYRSVFSEIFFEDSSIILPIAFSWDTMIMVFTFGIFITLLASFSTIGYVKSLHPSQLLMILGADEMNVVYDEKTLFPPENKQEIPPKEPGFYKSNPLNKSDSPQTVGLIGNASQSELQQTVQSQQSKPTTEVEYEKHKNTSIKQKKRKKSKKHQLYEDPVLYAEKRNAKISNGLIFASIVPLFAYLIIYLGDQPNVPDIIITIAEQLQMLLFLFSMFLIITPVLMVVGIIRKFAVEKPVRWAKITKKISSWFIKNRGYLCGIEMVKRKQYTTVIYIVGIFTALLTFSNVFLNTTSRQYVLESNINIGADVRGTMTNINLNQTSDLIDMENQMKKYTTSSGATVVNDVVSYYSEKITSGIYSYSQTNYYLDIQSYLEIISEDDKYLPYNSFKSEIQSLINHNSNPEKVNTGAIINEIYARYNLVELGDTININHTYFNTSSNAYEYDLFKVEIVQIMNLMPGIYNSIYSYGSSTEIILMDSKSHNQANSSLHSKKFYSLIDINPALTTNTTLMSSYIKNASLGYAGYSKLDYYDQDWNKLDYELNMQETGFYGIIYLEFLIIGILIAFGLAILFLSIQKENKYFNGVLLARGFGRKGLLKLILSKMFIIFLIGVLSGLFSGFVTSITFIKVASSMGEQNQLQLPIFFNPIELVSILGLIVAFSFGLYLLSYYFESRKNITHYFHKF